MNNIFDFLNPFQNDELSNLTKEELNEFLNLLSNYNLEYREGLSLQDNNSFGLEIECDHIPNRIITEDIINLGLNHPWKATNDASLDKGVEVISSILGDDKTTWEDLYKICSYLDSKAKSLDAASAHVHVGAHSIKTKEAFINFLRLWGTYENIIFRFGFGERLTSRELIGKFARSKSFDYWNDAHLIEKFNLSYNEVVELLHGSKYTALNFNNLSRKDNIFKTGNTIEFRYANGSLNPIIWQNLVNLDVNLVNKANSDLDIDIIAKRHDIVKDYLGNIPLYDEIFLDQALEFADLLFNNNLDKIYFLSQYLKGFNNKSNSRKDNISFTKILTKNH